MEILSSFFNNIVLLSNAMSFYILAGLLIAGFLKQIIPDDYINKHLGDSKISSVVKATIIGIPMPVCSCSVVPLAKSLEKEGASKGAVQSFMISTPITGADSIMATYSFFGIFFTLYRVVTSAIIAITTGLIQNLVDNKENKKSDDNNVACVSCCCDNTVKEKKKIFSIKSTFVYAYAILFKDIYFSLFVGILLGALFTTFMPKEYLALFFENKFLTYTMVLLISVPLYVCATASLPIAASFMLSGMSAGAAFVFLSAGPATNSITMSVVASMFGKKSLFIYTFTICSMSIFFGYILDLYFSDFQIFNNIHKHEDESFLNTISTSIMFLMIFYYIITEKFLKLKKDSCWNIKNIK